MSDVAGRATDRWAQEAAMRQYAKAHDRWAEAEQRFTGEGKAALAAGSRIYAQIVLRAWLAERDDPKEPTR